MINDVCNGFDRNEYTLSVFIDLSKAFDTVPHDILLHKLNCIGIRGIVNKWFESYLKQRKQFVSYNGTDSSVETITSGVPQGSVLGPILFLIFINDMVKINNKLKWTLFADDTTIYITGNHLPTLINEMNNGMESLYSWLTINKLILNKDKTKFMIFHHNRKRMKQNFEIPVFIDGVKIEKVDHFKFLGVLLHENLNWTSHINSLCLKLTKTVAMLNRARHTLPESSLIMLYNSFFLSHLNYCSLVWSFTTETNLYRLKLIQKSAIRTITFQKFRSHTTPIFKSLKILPLDSLFLYKIGVFMYNFFYK